ncbi:MAG: hypothetical protein ACYS0I_06065 [Planctomycetota bacterium]|jgi:hypothetical protein
MKRIIFTLAVLILASPALAAVDIWCANSPSDDPNVLTVYYDATGEDPCLVRAFAIDIVADNDVNILDVCDLSTDYWVHPGSIVIVDGEVTNEGSLVCEPDVGPPGQTGTPDTNWITIEMASLYAATDPCHPTAPPNQGELLKFTVNGNCCITLSENTVRGGVVMEDPDASPTVNLTGVCVVVDCWYPECWDWPGQCLCDIVGPDGDVDTDDFLAIKRCFGSVKGSPDYNPCADCDRDGDCDTDDFLVFKPNFGATGQTGCTPGDLNGVYCP